MIVTIFLRTWKRLRNEKTRDCPMLRNNSPHNDKHMFVMSPLPWLQIAFSLVLASLPLASNICNESASLSAANTYHFTNCLNVSFSSIPSNNVALVVEDSTIVALSINTLQLSLTNVTLRFIRCSILSDLSLSSGVDAGLVVNGLTVELIACSVTFNTTALNNADRPAAFLFLYEPQGIDNLWIRMANSTYNLTSTAPSLRGDFGFLNINQYTRIAQLHNISVIIEDSRIDLLCTLLEESEEVVVRSDSWPSLIRHLAYRQDNSSFTSSILDVFLSFRNITGRMQGSMSMALVMSEGIIVNKLSIRVSSVAFQMSSYGPYLIRSMQRSGRFIDFNDVPCNGCTIDIVNSQLYFTSVAGSLTQVESATMLRGVSSAFVSIGVLPGAVAADGTVLPTLPSAITLRNCHLVTYNMGGQFSYMRGGIQTSLVELTASSKLYQILLNDSTLNATVHTACPYRRMVKFDIDSPLPYVNTSSVALNIMVSLVYLAAPTYGVTVTVLNSSLTANVTMLAKCPLAQPTSTIAIQPGFPSTFDFATSIAFSVASVFTLDENFVAQSFSHSFSVNPTLLAFLLPSQLSPPAGVTNTHISIYNVNMSLIDHSSYLSANSQTTTLPNNFLLALSLALLASLGGEWNNSTADIAQTQLHTPAIAFTSSVLRDTSIAISGGNSSGALATWLSNGTQDAVTSVYLSNVSCGAGCGTSSITVRDFPLPVDVVSRGSGGGLVALLNGSDALLSGVAWRFSDIHVRVRRRRSVPFVLFDANVATVNDPLVDVSLSCVSWNGLRTVPLVGPPLARMYQDSAVPGGCVFPAAPTFSQTFVVANSDDRADTTAVGSAAEFLAAVSVVLSAIAVVGNPLDAADMQMFSALGLSMCAPKGMQASRGPMAYLLSPFVALGDRWSAGGNVLVSVAFALLHCAGTYALGTIRTTPQRKHLPGMSRWEAIAARGQWPHLSFVVSLLLTNGANFFGLSLLRQHRSASDVGVGCIALLWSVAVPAAAVAMVVTRHPLPLGGRASSSLRLQRYVSFDVMCRGKPWAVRALLPIGFWEPEDERRRIGRLIGGVRAKWVRWGVAPQVAATALANVIAVAVPSDGDALCTAQWCLLATLPICFACFLAVCRPTRVAAASATGAGIYALMGAISIAAALVVSHRIDAESGRIAIEVLSIMLALLNCFRCLHTVSIFLLERRAAARSDGPSSTSISGLPMSSSVSPSSALRSLTFSSESKPWHTRGMVPLEASLSFGSLSELSLGSDSVANNLRIVIENICGGSRLGPCGPR